MKHFAGSIVVLWLVLGAQPARSVPPTISGITLSGGNLQLTISSDRGVTNQIQTIIDLSRTNWTPLTNISVAQSPYTFVDTFSSPAPERFYRVLALNSSVPPGMVLIPAGSFQMGDTFNEGAAWELPVHSVYVSGFYLDKFEVTKGLWDQVVGWGGTNGYVFDSAGSGKAANHPVQSINWYDMARWCNARSEREGRVPAYYADAGLTQVYRTGDLAPFVNWQAGYRLPTEAEWEKGARGGASGTRFPWSDVLTISETQANYYSDSSQFPYDIGPVSGFNAAFNDGVMPYTSSVGSLAPNGYGLYDMAGNVWEWCWDWAGNYTSASQADPHGPDTGSTRVGRGGNWNYYAEHCRNAYRYGNSPDYVATNIGFRTALPAP